MSPMEIRQAASRKKQINSIRYVVRAVLASITWHC